MSNYKPFHEKVAELFVRNLESGNTPFRTQSPESSSVFQTPVNASTGKNYRGLNALWLSMQPFEDPRWMTLNQANKMQIKIPKGSGGTMINIVKTSESFPMLDDDGKRIKDEHGKTKYQTVQLEKPSEETHWVFNAAQLAIGQDRKTQVSTETGAERLNKFIIAAGIELVLHNRNEEDYSGALLHQLANWTAHPERLNRETIGKPGDAEYATEELKTGLATLLLGSEMGIAKYNANHFEKLIPEWITLIKADATVLSAAVNDAQKIADYILETESKLGLRKYVPLKPMPLDLEIGDEIKYSSTTYKVVDAMKGNKLKIEDLSTGAKMPISPSDGLYKSLVQAKYRGDSVTNETSNVQSRNNSHPNDIRQESSENRTLKR